MWKIELETTDICEELTKICQKYQDLLKVDICFGRYLVDGCSLLGVMSLMLHEVQICIPENAEECVIKDFEDEIIKIGAFKTER